MSEREKRDAAAKQRNMELSNEMAMKMAEYGLSPDVTLPTAAAVKGIGNVQMPTSDPLTSFAKQISLGQGPGKNMIASPRFDVFNGTEAATGDMSDAATNADMSGAGMRGSVSAYGAPTMPRTKLGLAAQLPNVQTEINAPPMTTSAGDENLPRMSLIDPVTGQSTRYKRDITQSLPYLSMQAQTKANEERNAAQQQAIYEREAALEREKNARTLKDKADAADELQRQSQVVLQTYQSTNPLAKMDYDRMTPAQQRSLKTIADAEVKMFEDNAKIRASAAARPEKSKSVWVMDPKDPTKTILVPEEEAIRQGFSRAPTGGGSGSTGGSLASGMSLSANARLLAGMNEAQRAKARMDAFEDDWLSKKVNPGLFNNVTANIAQLSPKEHPVMSAFGQAGTQLSLQGARWEQYKRDAALIARAEQLISSRGGSESSVAANTSLASAVPGAGYEESIKAARASREALFGEYGGIMQALSTNPALRDKLIEGLEAAKRNEDNFKYSDVGKEVEKYRQSAPAAPRTRLERAPTASSATSDPYQALVDQVKTRKP
jgi:hypothetical protein